MKPIELGTRRIGPGYSSFVIAEAGVNHNGDLQLAQHLVDVAVQAGADAVKFQTFRADRVVSAFAAKADYQQERTSADESQLDMIAKLELSEEDHCKLAEYCRAKSIIFLSTPFDEESVDLLDRLSAPAFKVASGEITNWPLLQCIGAKGKPVILSTGMSYLGEVEDAIRALEAAGCSQLVLLHCSSCYPAEPRAVNLQAIPAMASAFRLPVGLSDHSLGTEIAFAAVALGACIIEKHFTLDKAFPGPDHAMSLDPAELKDLVRGIRAVEAALGDGLKRPTDQEWNVREIARRSIVARDLIPPGTLLTREMLAFKRPGSGISPLNIRWVVGRKTARLLSPDAIITYEDLA